ncbi:beta-ketoacyl-ACP synthase III [Hamadaea tsunoensis]|uniref:beta-ketoacyl-ACP synthase III n=1 Tax=Hamadaea tsunoensis TaxID=53368 RepID=UPI0004092EA3|nr:beta-ketoacyl-ACP synthase III [Hamadaea tsunoensis]
MEQTAVITGLGACLPPLVVGNEDLARSGLDTSDEWIVARTGIERRRRVTPGTATSDLGVAAARAALASAAVSEVDLVLLATTTPDRLCPASAPRVATRLGLAGVPAFDLAAVCSGFVYGLVVARALIRAEAYARVLLIGADTYSSIVDPLDRNTAVIFGDGAGAVVLERGPMDAAGAILDADLGSDGGGHDLITLVEGGSRYPARLGGTARQHRYLHMKGTDVFRYAVRQMTASTQAVLARAGWRADSVEAFVGHQANQRILNAVADRVGIAPQSRIGNLREVGNTAAASIPLAMAEAPGVRPGGRTVLTAFGGGVTWGSVGLTWPAAMPVHSEPAPPPDPQDERLP